MGSSTANFVTAFVRSQSHCLGENGRAADGHKGGFQYHRIFGVPSTRAGRLTRQNRPMSGACI